MGAIKRNGDASEDTLIIKNLLFLLDITLWDLYSFNRGGGSFKDLLPPLVGIDLNAIARLASDAHAGYAARQLALEPDDLGIIQPRS